VREIQPPSASCFKCLNGEEELSAKTRLNFSCGLYMTGSEHLRSRALLPSILGELDLLRRRWRRSAAEIAATKHATAIADPVFSWLPGIVTFPLHFVLFQCNRCTVEVVQGPKGFDWSRVDETRDEEMGGTPGQRRQNNRAKWIRKQNSDCEPVFSVLQITIYNINCRNVQIH
jgi:hypothetical protein